LGWKKLLANILAEINVAAASTMPEGGGKKTERKKWNATNRYDWRGNRGECPAFHRCQQFLFPAVQIDG